MPQINFSKRTLTCKLVYFGPGLSGKTTNLEYIYGQVPEERRGELTSIATHGDRTIFYDYLPVEMGAIAGLQTRLQLFTVPGQPYYAATRKLVLVGVDGVVFVADSQRERLAENLESFAELDETLREQHKQLTKIPLVVQWNKRDLPNALPLAELERELNKVGAPSFESVASTGQGVLPVLRRISRLVLTDAQAQYGSGEQAKAPAPRPAPPAAPQPPRKISQLPKSTDQRPIVPVSKLRIPLNYDSADSPTISVDPSISAPGEDAGIPGGSVLDEEADRAIGQTVGGCTILAKLGEGGMGAVYLARHPVLNKDFVIKTLKPERTQNKVSVKRFFAEARATARLEHENVVRVQDVGTTEAGMHYMVMQYIDGRNLEDQVREEGPPTAQESARIAMEVANALVATHSAGVIHRDVKPQNVIVTKDGDVKLIDFGLARDVAEKQRLTRPGGLVGTPAYMAPEMVAGEGEVDGRVDIFALGLTFYYLLTGETPFYGTDIHDLFLGKARLKAPELYAPDLGIEYRMVLERMLAKARQDRYTSAAALAADLQRLAKGQPLSASSDPPNASFWLWKQERKIDPLPSPEFGETAELRVPDMKRISERAPRIDPRKKKPKPRPKPAPPPPATAMEQTATSPHGPQRRQQPKGPPQGALAREIERASRIPANRFGDCLLLTRIDQTPFGALHRAWDTVEQQLVAVRIFSDRGALSRAALFRLEQAKRLEHPHISRVLRFGMTERKELYLITELFRGRSLSSFRFKPKQVVMAIRDAALAIQAANKQGQLHGNLQPASVLIDEAGNGRVLDFGLGGVLNDRISPRYRAPECLRGPGDARSEVYALGATFYFGLTRQPPGTGQIIPPRQLRGGIPKPIQAICLRCLATSPDARYPTPGQFASDLGDFLRTRKPNKD